MVRDSVTHTYTHTHTRHAHKQREKKQIIKKNTAVNMACVAIAMTVVQYSGSIVQLL